MVYSSFEGMAIDFRAKQRVLRTYLSPPDPSLLLVDDIVLSTSHSSSLKVDEDSADREKSSRDRVRIQAVILLPFLSSKSLEVKAHDKN